MRIIIILFLFVALVLEGLSLLAFTGSGNSILLPYINSYLAKNVPQAKVEVIKFRLKPSSIGVVAKVNDSIDVRAKGDISILSQTFDIDYVIDAQEIKTPTFSLKEHINIKGNAKGDPDDMRIHGDGIAFDSTIKYGLTLLKQNPQNIQIDIDGANIKSLLAVAGQKPYSTGRLSLHANMPTFAPLNPKVDATLDVAQGILNRKLLAHDFNITLPKENRYTTHWKIKTKDARVTFDGNLDSSLGKLAVDNGKYHVLSNTMAGAYHLQIPKLENLASLTNAPLRGELTVDGEVSLKENKPTVTGITHSVGGKSSFAYKGDTLKVTLDQISNAKLLYKVGQPTYLAGTTTGSANLTSLKNLSGNFDLTTKGAANTKTIKKEMEIDLGNKFYIANRLKGTIKNSKVLAKLSTNTSMANMKMPNISYDIPTATLVSSYTLNIPDMGKLEPVVGRKFKGSMKIDGEIKKAKSLLVTGHGKEFGGTIDFKLRDEHLDADVQGVTVSKVMAMLDYPQVLEALSKAKVKYNTKTSSGSIYATLDNAKILPSKLTALLKQFGIIDLGKERFNNSKFSAKMSKKMIDFNLDARSKNSYLTLNHGKLTKSSGALNAKVNLKIKGKDLQATIGGTIDHPKLSLDGSKYLQDKAKAKIKQKFGGKIDKAKSKIKNKLGDQVSGALKGLF